MRKHLREGEEGVKVVGKVTLGFLGRTCGKVLFTPCGVDFVDASSKMVAGDI